MAVNDLFGGINGQDMCESASDFYQITPDDNNDLPRAIRQIWYTGGQVTVNTLLTAGRVLPAAMAGSDRAIRITRVLNTGTTATAIYGYV